MSFNKETSMYEGYIYKITNDVNDKNQPDKSKIIA